MTSLRQSATFYIRTYDNMLSPELCGQLQGLLDSAIGSFNEPWRRCKVFEGLDSTGLYEPVRTQLRKCFQAYVEDTGAATLHRVGMLESPNLFRYVPDDTAGENLFSLHADAWNMETASRAVSIIAYLNDVSKGGETRFPLLDFGARPKSGSVLLFPSNWSFEHEGLPPKSGPKDVLVSWLHWAGVGHHFRVAAL